LYRATLTWINPWGFLRVDLLGHGVNIAGLFEVSIFLHTSPPLTELLLQKETLTPDEFPALEPIGQHDEVASSIASAAR